MKPAIYTTNSEGVEVLHPALIASELVEKLTDVVTEIVISQDESRMFNAIRATYKSEDAEMFIGAVKNLMVGMFEEMKAENSKDVMDKIMVAHDAVITKKQ